MVWIGFVLFCSNTRLCYDCDDYELFKLIFLFVCACVGLQYIFIYILKLTADDCNGRCSIQCGIDALIELFLFEALSKSQYQEI